MPEVLLPGSVLALSGQAADRLLRLDSGDAALLRSFRQTTRPRYIPPRTCPPPCVRRVLRSPPWPTRWNGGWAKSSPPTT